MAIKVVGHYARWLKQRAILIADTLRGRKNQLPGNNYIAPQAWRTRDSGRALSHRVRRRTDHQVFRKLFAQRPLQAVFHSMLVSRPAPSIHAAGTILGYVRPERYARCRRRSISGERPIPPHLRSSTKSDRRTRATGTVNAPLPITEREAREATALTYGMITMVDDAIGSILGWLKTLRLDENTVVIFTSDHGDFMGDHQLLLKGALHYRGLVRVPFIWSDPQYRIARAGQCGYYAARSTSRRRFLTACRTGGPQRHARRKFNAGSQRRQDRPRVALVIEEHQRRGYMGFENNFRARSLITKQQRLTLYEGAELGRTLRFRRTIRTRSNNLWNEPDAQARRNELTELFARQNDGDGRHKPVGDPSRTINEKNTFQSFKTFKPFKSYLTIGIDRNAEALNVYYNWCNLQ